MSVKFSQEYVMEGTCWFDHVSNQIPNSYNLRTEKTSYLFALNSADGDCWVEKRTLNQLSVLQFLKRDIKTFWGKKMVEKKDFSRDSQLLRRWTWCEYAPVQKVWPQAGICIAPEQQGCFGAFHKFICFLRGLVKVSLEWKVLRFHQWRDVKSMVQLTKATN